MPQGQFHIANSAHTREFFLQQAEEIMEQHPYVVWEWMFGKPRTGKQNAALHVFLRLLSQELNAKGYSVQTFFKEGVEVPFSPEVVKENIWRPIQVAVSGQESSTDLTTTQIQEVYENVNRALSNKGIHIPFPEANGK